MMRPPIVLIDGFAEDPDGLFQRLSAETAWDESMRARKTASYGAAYEYSQMRYAESEMPDVLDILCAAIDRRLGFYPNNCLLNYYLDGDASMGFHSDTSEELAPETGVAIVSLGAPRSMAFRLKKDKSVELREVLRNGSLLYMSIAMQEDWLHAIPKAPGAGSRISATFRRIVK
jgi:alkylated DNA repair dioxygenase AlkB